MSDNYSLEIKTVQSAAFKVLTEALKEILTDANFEVGWYRIKGNGYGFITYCISSSKIKC